MILYMSSHTKSVVIFSVKYLLQLYKTLLAHFQPKKKYFISSKIFKSLLIGKKLFIFKFGDWNSICPVKCFYKINCTGQKFSQKHC